MRYVHIGDDDAGQRVDNLLLRELRGVPRGRIYSMLRRGEVRISGRRVKPGYRLAVGDSVRLPPVHTLRATEAPNVGAGLADALEASILHEDEAMLVVDKPSGLAVHGGSGVKVALVESLRVLRPDIRNLELAHRIDRDTSGCVLLAKRRSVLRRLHDALRERTAKKRYLAIAEGAWPRHLRHVDAPLERVLARNGERFVRVSAAGKASSTRIRVMRRLEGATLLEVFPETGRTH
ncbi:MAG: pseudouridine synthase, partial [Pseudomonadales bacterium]|nr:pseudouridine synthase [Pseudomonadales bacterium]